MRKEVHFYGDVYERASTDSLENSCAFVDLMLAELSKTHDTAWQLRITMNLNSARQLQLAFRYLISPAKEEWLEGDEAVCFLPRDTGWATKTLPHEQCQEVIEDYH